MSISGIYSLASEIYDSESGISTGAVDISLKEYNENNELFSEDGKMVMPGEEISLIPRINNIGIDCYIRAKITYTIDGEEYNILDYIEGNYKSWTKENDYYYLNSILEKDNSVDLFNKVTIPTLSLDSQEKQVIIHIVVEAIQSKNFDGNWDNAEIKESIDRTYDMNYDGSSSVIFEEDANEYITIDDHFFDNLGNLLPGDTTSEEVEIHNISYDRIKYYLSIDYGDLSDEEKDLLRNITLRIKNSRGEVLVLSNLLDKTKHNLGLFSYDEREILTIELSLPTKIDNEYSKLFTKITWKFSYDTISQNRESINPNTWDLKFDLSITVFILSSIGFLIILFWGKKETDNIEKNEKKKEVKK